MNELKASEERARKAAADADRLAEEVRQEQEHATHVDRQRKALELNAKELQAKIDDAERAMIQCELCSCNHKKKEFQSEPKPSPRSKTEYAVWRPSCTLSNADTKKP